MPTVVYKLGGSLLGRDDLPGRLRRTLAAEEGIRPLLVVGGGAAADVVREWDRRHGLGDERAHWLALRAMALNECLVRDLLPESRIVRDRAAAEEAWASARVPILCAHDFLAREEPASADPLPHTWDVTSDSVAAWVAIRWPADRLVLLKPVPLPAGAAPERLGPPLVDGAFSRLQRRVRQTRWQCL